MTQPLNTHVLEIEDFPEPTPESIKIEKQRIDHLFRLTSLIRVDLEASTVKQMQDNSMLLCISGIYYFLIQESNHYDLQKINIGEGFKIPFYTQKGAMLPPECVAEAIANELHIEVSIPIPKPGQKS